MLFAVAKINLENFISNIYKLRILGYRRAVPTVGRVLNITSELYENAERKLKKTFFISPGSNLHYLPILKRLI